VQLHGSDFWVNQAVGSVTWLLPPLSSIRPAVTEEFGTILSVFTKRQNSLGAIGVRT